MNKLITILGPTCSGKTSLAVKIAYKFNGEIVSADSRQVYRGMDIGTGKDLEEYTVKVNSKSKRIRYHLIDVVDPSEGFNLAQYQKLAYKVIDEILARGKLPFLVGGTGLYLQAVVDGYIIPRGKPKKIMRKILEKLNTDQLFAMLTIIRPELTKTLNESDKKNKRRLLRYIEMPERPARLQEKYKTLILGLKWPQKVLDERIHKRVDMQFEEGLVGEIENLHKKDLSWERLESFGLEYKFVAQYLQKKLDYDEMVKLLNTAIRQYSKRQMTWFRRWERQGREIHWVQGVKEAESLTQTFIEVKN